MSSLIAPRPPQWRRMHEDEDRQGALFGGEAFTPPRRPMPPREEAAPPRDETVTRTPREDVAVPRDEAVTRAPREDVAPPRDEAVARAPREDVAPPRDEAVARTPREDVAMPRGETVAPPHEFVAPPEAGEIRVSRGALTPLAGPTLDDVVTHAWEGLGAGVPAACPVCHGEIEPALGGALRGHCGTCGVTLD
jgi:hypothetical protein